MRYEVILADPPWRYNNRANHNTRFRGGACGHYPLMDMNSIMNLPVSIIADDNAVLFLWCTFPYLKEQLEVFEKWGFIYKTLAFSWIKLNPVDRNPFFGVGYYTKSNCEPLLIGTRGKPIKPAVDTISSVVMAPRGEHSKKPSDIVKRIDEMYPSQSKIELFSRNVSEGWDACGNGVDGKDIKESLWDIAKSPQRKYVYTEKPKPEQESLF